MADSSIVTRSRSRGLLTPETQNVQPKPITKEDMLDIFASKSFDQAVYRAMVPIINEFTSEFKAMRDMISKQNKKITALETKLKSHQEQIANLTSQKPSKEKSEKYQNLIISGLKGKPENSYQILHKFFTDKMKVPIQQSEICVKLLNKSSPNQLQQRFPDSTLEDSPIHGSQNSEHDLKLLCTFTNIWRRREIWSKRTMLKGSKIFLSEDLPKADSSLLFECRQLKRQKIIKLCFSNDMAVYIRTHQGRDINVKTMADLDKIKAQINRSSLTDSSHHIPGTSTPVEITDTDSRDSWHDASTIIQEQVAENSLDFSSFLGFPRQEDQQGADART